MATDGDPANFVKGTDSLQAIRDYIAGTTALDGINLDHLALTSTGVNADGELDTHITASSILGHIMATDADPSNYNASSDSLQAIGADADAILEDTITISGGTLPDSPTAGSLARYIASGGTALGQPLPTNMSLIDIVGDFTGAHDGTAQEDNIKASMDLAHTALTKITNNVASLNSAGGINYYVDSSASDDTGNGLTWATAKKTIQAAVTLAANYDTIYIRGSFSEAVTPSAASVSNVTLKGVTGTKRRPQWVSGAAGSACLVISGDGWVLEDLRFQGATNTVALVKIDKSGANLGNGSVIKNCYFHGGGDSLAAICYYGGSIQNELIGNHITDFGGANTGYQAAVYGDSYVQSAGHFKIEDNFFSENVDHLRLQAFTCLIKGNIFQSEGNLIDTTIKLDTVCSGEDVGGNCVVDNYFGDTAANIKNTEGYYGTTDDLWSGNHCTDADDWGVPDAS